MNGRFQIAIHILTLLDVGNGELLASDYIAGSININPALVRKEISNLRKAGLIESKEGTKGGYMLAIPAEQITLAAIFKAVNQKSILGKAKNIPNPECIVGKQINRHIGSLFDNLDKQMINKLSTITLAYFSKKFE